MLVAVALLFLVALTFTPLVSRRRAGWPQLLHAILLSLVIVVIPLGVFTLSSVLLPSWQGAARCGWIDGFHSGKYALTPVVLFAIAALYRLEVNGGVQQPRWVQWGLYSGAVTAVLCHVFAYACIVFEGNLGWLWAALCYVPVWYCVRAFQCGLNSLQYLWTTLAMLPFWTASWFWSKSALQALPDTAPEEGFVVTAAGRGHSLLVGPFFALERRGVVRRVNRQLHDFWNFEAQWQVASPRTHRAFRKLYNRLGPVLAAHITSPWRADLAYLALKPLELLARAAVSSTDDPQRD